MRTTVLAGAGRARELAGLLRAVARPTGVASGWEITGVPGVRVHVDPDGTVDVTSRDGAAVLRGALGDPKRVMALIGADAQVAAVVAERYRPTGTGRW